MVEFDSVNLMFLTGNLLFWGALFLWPGRKGRVASGRDWAVGAAGLAESMAVSFAQALAGLLEFAVYGAGMIRMADLILQGIAVPGREDRALLGVRILLAESMLLLFPLWKMWYGWKREENGRRIWEEWEDCGGGGWSPAGEGLYGGNLWGRDSMAGNAGGTCRSVGNPCRAALAGGAKALEGYRRIWKGVVLEEGESVLGMLLLLGLTMREWQEPDPIRALVGQVWLLLLFFCYGYLKRRREQRGYVDYYGKMGVPWGCGGSAVRAPVQDYGGKGRGTAPQGFAGNVGRARQMEYLKNVEEQYQRTRELWHDLKNHIKVLEILAQEERFGELTDYLDSFQRDVEQRMVPTRTGCAPVDALLGDKLYRAGRQQVEMSLQLCELSQMGIEAVDLCVILGNLLDNALEACALVDGRGRIGLRIRREEEFCYITVINTSGEPHREGTGYATGKRDRDNGVGHGLGLRSAERIAHRYGGLLAADYGDGEFRVVVRLQEIPASGRK